MSVLRHVSYTLGEDLGLERERESIAIQALKVAGAADYEIADAYRGVTVIDGKITRIIACYVQNPAGKP